MIDLPKILDIPNKLLPFIEKFNEYNYFILEGGRGGGKSQSVARFLLYLSEHNKLRIVCGRETQNSITESVYSLMTDLILKFNLDFEVTATKIVHRSTGSVINFRGFREQGAVKIQGMEGVDIIWIDEAQAITELTLDKLIPTIRKDSSKIIFTMNRHVYNDPAYATFIDRSDCLHIKINYSDNPFCTDKLIREAEECKKRSLQDYNHIWEGEPLSQSDNCLFDHIELMRSKEMVYGLRDGYGLRLAGFDISRMGDDKTAGVIIEQRGSLTWEVILVEEWDKQLAPYTVGRMLDIVNRNGVCKSGVDEEGLGGPVLDFAQLSGTFVGFRNTTLSFESDPFFGNNRTKCAALVKDMVSKGHLIIKDSDLIEELESIRYTFDRYGRRILIPKDIMKKKYNCKSPNKADALFIAGSLIEDVLQERGKNTNRSYYNIPSVSAEQSLFEIAGVR